MLTFGVYPSRCTCMLAYNLKKKNYYKKKNYWEGIQNGIMEYQIHCRSAIVRCQCTSSFEWIQISVRLPEHISKVTGYKVIDTR